MVSNFASSPVCRGATYPKAADRVRVSIHDPEGKDFMGLMDNIKKAQEMAQQAQQGSRRTCRRGAMPDAADMEYAQTAQKIAQSGLPGVATINAIGETGKTDAGVNKQYAIDVSIELEDGDKYDTTVLQNLTEDAINSGHYEAGKRFEVKVDPDDKSKALLYGLAD